MTAPLAILSALVDEQRALLDALAQPLAVEVACAALAQVCHDYGEPFAAVRTISDRADAQAHGDFQHFVTQIASQYSHHILMGLLSLLLKK